MTRRTLAACFFIGTAVLLPAVTPVGPAASGKERNRDKQESRKSSRRDADDSKSNKSDLADDDWIAQVPSSKRKDARRELQQFQEGRDRDLAAAGSESDAGRREQRRSEAMNRYQSGLAALKARYLDAKAQKSPWTEDNTPEAVKRQQQIAQSAKWKLEHGGGASGAPASPQQVREQLAAVEGQLADESRRHDAKMEDLRRDEQAAGGNAGKRRRAQKSIEQENASYDSRRSDLERQRQDLQSKLGAAPAK